MALLERAEVTERIPPSTSSSLYLAGMTQRVGAKGQVVIPKDLRERAGLGPGAGVSFEPVDEGIVVRRADRRSTLRGRFSGSGMAARLVEDRRSERP
jgi:AbrB family looped-hinge helix DNA binding protein